MIVCLQISILGVYMIACAGDLESIQKLGFVCIMTGILGSTIIYENFKEKFKRMERQLNAKHDIMETNNTKLMER